MLYKKPDSEARALTTPPPLPILQPPVSVRITPPTVQHFTVICIHPEDSMNLTVPLSNGG